MPTIVPNHDQTLVDLALLTATSLAQSLTPEGMALWLGQPNTRLGGRTPVELLYEGSFEPYKLAEAMADGVFL